MTVTTPCECPRAGWCARHQCVKTVFQHWDCRHVAERFDAWERGAGEQFQWADLPAPSTPVPDGPGFFRRVRNYGQAVGQHVQAGLRHVSEAVAETRLAICQTCDYCDRGSLICRHADCGCWLRTKTQWASQACPLGHWQAVSPDPVSPTSVES